MDISNLKSTGMHTQSLGHIRLFVTPCPVACQAPLSVEFSRQGYWSGLQFPMLVDLPNPGTEPASPESPTLAGEFFATQPPGKPASRAEESIAVSTLYF